MELFDKSVSFFVDFPIRQAFPARLFFAMHHASMKSHQRSIEGPKRSDCYSFRIERFGNCQKCCIAHFRKLLLPLPNSQVISIMNWDKDYHFKSSKARG